MCKLLALLSCGLLAFVAIDAQVKLDRDRDGLRGPVRIVQVRRMPVTSENGKMTEGLLVLSHAVSYDTVGNRTELTLYDDTGVLSRRIVYTHDAERKKRNGMMVYNTANVMVRKVNDTYGSDGFKVQSTIYDYDEDGTPSRKRVLTFDAFGGLSKVADYTADGTLVREDKAPFEQPVFNPNSQASEAIVEEQAGSEDRVVSFGQRMGNYSQLDAHGNWTTGRTPATFRKYESGKSVETTEIIYRTFTYY